MSCQFDSCDATHGGGIAVAPQGVGPDSSWPTLVHCEVNNCHVTEFGGGIYSNLSIMVEGGTLTDNAAGYDGGGLYSQGDSVLIKSVLVFGNHADQHGGGICLNASGTLRNCTLSGNTTYYDGGGLCCANPGQWGCSGDANLEHCEFSGNSGENGGGAITCGGFWHCCTFENNAATVDGGGGCASYGAIHNCRFLDNQAGAEGGGLSFNTGTLEGCDFLGNVSGGGGGGLQIGNAYQGSSTVTGCRSTGNRADRGGGVDFMLGSDNVGFDHCTFAGNSARLGGGIFVNESSQPTLRYSVVSGNCADSLGAMLFTEHSSSTANFVCSAVDSSGIAGSGAVTYTGPQVFTRGRAAYIQHSILAVNCADSLGPTLFTEPRILG